MMILLALRELYKYVDYRKAAGLHVLVVTEFIYYILKVFRTFHFETLNELPKQTLLPERIFMLFAKQDHAPVTTTVTNDFPQFWLLAHSGTL